MHRFTAYRSLFTIGCSLITVFLLAACLPSPGGVSPTPPTDPPTEIIPSDIPPPPTDEVPPLNDGILVGAIRWDGWYRGSPYLQNLFPEEWRHRLPFYATVAEDGQVSMASDSQAVMDQEILYAAANGIDYWIFNMYVLRDEQGNPIADETGWRAEDMNRSRELYLSSQYQASVKFSLMLGVGGHAGYNYGEHNWNFQVDEALAQMQEPSYQTVLDGRPLVYESRPLNAPPLAAGMKAGMFPLPGEGKLKKGWGASVML
jgi:hypothetical protein